MPKKPKNENAAAKPAARASRAEKTVTPATSVAAPVPQPTAIVPVAASAPSPSKSAAPSAPIAALAAPAADLPSVTTEQISARAHAIWIERGRPTPGSPLEDWLQAERELRRR